MHDRCAHIALTLALGVLACACSNPNQNALETEALGSVATLGDPYEEMASGGTTDLQPTRPSIDTPLVARLRLASRRVTQPAPIEELAESKDPAPGMPSATGISDEEITAPVAARTDCSSATRHERENEPSTRSTLNEIGHDLSRQVTPLPPPPGPHPGVAHEGEVNWVSLSTRSEATRVTINLGTAVGAKVGQSYDIVRGSDFICTIRIDAVRVDASEGVIVLPMPRRSPRSGDRVTVL